MKNINKLIICLIGNKGSGKDFFYKSVKEISGDTNYIRRVAFADVLKQEYIEDYNIWRFEEENQLTLEGLEKDKEAHRKGLQEWGDKRRKDNTNYFVEKTVEEIKNSKEHIIFITDCRFKNEQEQIVLAGLENGWDCEFIRIYGKSTQDSHASEQELLNLYADYHIVNSYMEDFLAYSLGLFLELTQKHSNKLLLQELSKDIMDEQGIKHETIEDIQKDLIRSI